MISEERVIAACNELKKILQKIKPSKLELLAAALVGRLLNRPIFVASSGSQFGGDAGTIGSNSRYFRVECKRYRKSSTLGIRSLLGEIDEAIRADSMLEAWILVATRDVNEQLARNLIRKGEETGNAVIFLEFQKHEFSRFAVLCSFAHEVVRRFATPKAATLALEIQKVANSDTEESYRVQQSRKSRQKKN